MKTWHQVDPQTPGPLTRILCIVCHAWLPNWAWPRWVDVRNHSPREVAVALGYRPELVADAWWEPNEGDYVAAVGSAWLGVRNLPVEALRPHPMCDPARMASPFVDDPVYTGGGR